MKLQDILSNKGHHVHTIDPNATLADVVDQLVAHNCGSLVVMSGDQMVGIITERDILRACNRFGGDLERRTVGQHMSQQLTTGTPNDELTDIMGLLTERRIRHLPIVNDGQLVGIISIGDLVKAQHDQLSVENFYLKSYIHG